MSEKVSPRLWLVLEDDLDDSVNGFGSRGSGLESFVNLSLDLPNSIHIDALQGAGSIRDADVPQVC